MRALFLWLPLRPRQFTRPFTNPGEKIPSPAGNAALKSPELYKASVWGHPTSFLYSRSFQMLIQSSMQDHIR
jgi:hypothetical protein